MTVDENVIVQIVLVLATITAVIVTWWKTRESNNMLKSELNTKLRPVLNRTVIGDTKRTAPDGSVIHEPVYSLQHNKVLFHFTNSGSLPAVNIMQTSFVAIKENEEFTNIKPIENKSLPAMAPNEKYSIDLFYDKEHFEEAHRSDKCYFGLRLDYEDPNGKKYHYSMEGHFFDHGYLYLDKVEMN